MSRRSANRRYFEAQRKAFYDRQTREAQERILAAGPEHPMYRNVYNSLAKKQGR